MIEIQHYKNISDKQLIELQNLKYLSPVANMVFEWAIYVEKTSPNIIDLHFFKIFQNNITIGSGVLLVIRGFKLTPFFPVNLRRIFSIIQKVVPNSISLNIGFLEAPLLNESGLFFTEKVDHNNFNEIIQKLREYSKIALNLDLLCIKSNESNIEKEIFYKLNLLEIASFNVAKLKIDFKTFDDYLRSLSESRRRSIVSNKRKQIRHNISIEQSVDIKQECREVYSLFLKTCKNAALNGGLPMPIEVGKLFFSQLNNLSQSTALNFIAKFNKKPIAFLTCLYNEDILIAKYSGMDYKISRDSASYFNLFYEAIDFAINNSIKEINFGVTNDHVKKRLGCEFFPRKYWIDVYKAILHPIKWIVKKNIDSSIP